MADTEILPVIVNSSGGTAKGAGDSLETLIRAAFAHVERPISLELVSADALLPTIERYRDAPRIAVGGGDGTLGSAAQLLAGSGRELAVLPLGTRNHFARQLGVPLEIGEAATLAANGSAIAIDCGRAGDRTFINNASLGAYVELVRQRDRSTLPKAPASLVAGWRVLRRLRPRCFELAIDGKRRTVWTSLLFVGNNRYEIEEGKPAEREALDDGMLSILAPSTLSRAGLLWAAIRVALGKADMRHDFALETEARSVRLEGSGTIGIALDGEELELPLPLDIAIDPGALRVVAPHG